MLPSLLVRVRICHASVKFARGIAIFVLCTEILGKKGVADRTCTPSLLIIPTTLHPHLSACECLFCANEGAKKGPTNTTKRINFKPAKLLQIMVQMQFSDSCGLFGPRKFTHTQMVMLELI